MSLRSRIKTPSANNVVNVTPIAAPGSIRPSRRIASINTTAATAAAEAPKNIGPDAIEPVSSNDAC